MENYISYWPKQEKGIIPNVFRNIDVELKIKSTALYSLYNRFSWKRDFYRDLKQIKGELGLREIFDDLAHKNTKKSNFELWKSHPRKMAEEIFGLKFPEVVPNDALREVIMDGMYFSFRDFVPEPGNTIVDVGSQYGDYSLMCSKEFSVGKVISFEPLPDVFDVFQRAIEMNGIKNVFPMNAAAGSEDRVLKVLRGKNMAGVNGSEELTVNSVKLDSTVKERVDILKIDVEGFELHVLEGAKNLLNNYHPKIIMETHSSDLNKKAISFLGDYGYNVIHRGKGRYSEMPGMDLVRNIYLN